MVDELEFPPSRPLSAGVMPEPGKIELRTIHRPDPGPGELLVRIKACAICTTEQRIFTGTQVWHHFPYVGGHEIAGVVESLGPGVETDLAVGDHVALVSSTCGHCENCRTGRTNKCSHRAGFWEHDGLWGTWGFADYRAVRPRGVQIMDPEVPFEQAALVEPLSCVVHGARRLGITLGDEVVVIGAGSMGLLNLLVLKAMGAVVTVLDLQAARWQRALEAGAYRAFAPDDATPQRIKQMTRGRGAAAVVVTSSSRQAFETAHAILGPMGRILAFAAVYPNGEMPIDVSDLHRSEQHILGSVSSDIEDVLIAGKLISKRLIDVGRVVECVLPFERLAEAMELAVLPTTHRVILSM